MANSWCRKNISSFLQFLVVTADLLLQLGFLLLSMLVALVLMFFVSLLGMGDP